MNRQLNTASALNFNSPKALYFLAIFVALSYFAWFLYLRAINIPYTDDIIDILNLMLAMTSDSSLGTRIDTLVAHHNEHSTVASRLVYLLVHQIQGEINFRSLSFIANLVLPGLVALFCLGCRDKKHIPLVALIATLLLCNPRAYTLLVWNTATFAWYFVCAYAALALYFLGRASLLSLAIAILFAVGSNHSLVSGKFVWLVGLCFLLWQVLVERRRSWAHVALWLLSAALTLYLYDRGSHQPNTTAVMLSLFWASPAHVIAYAVASIGSAFSFGSVFAAILEGAAVLSILAIITLRDIKNQTLSWVHFYALFALLSMLAIAFGRAAVSELNFALSPRYSFASTNLLIATVLLLIDQGVFKHYTKQGVLVVGAIAACIASYVVYQPQLEQHLQRRIASYNHGIYSIYYFPGKQTEAIVETAIKTGLYQPPVKPVSARWEPDNQ